MLGYIYCVLYLFTLALISLFFEVDGGIFAITDIGCLPIFIFCGYDLDQKLCSAMGIKSTGLIGAAIGGGVGNELTDILGCIFDPTMWCMLPGVLIFGLLSLVSIYILHKWATPKEEDTVDVSMTKEEHVAWQEYMQR